MIKEKKKVNVGLCTLTIVTLLHTNIYPKQKFAEIQNISNKIKLGENEYIETVT